MPLKKEHALFLVTPNSSLISNVMAVSPRGCGCRLLGCALLGEDKIEDRDLAADKSRLDKEFPGTMIRGRDVGEGKALEPEGLHDQLHYHVISCPRNAGTC